MILRQAVFLHLIAKFPAFVQSPVFYFCSVDNKASSVLQGAFDGKVYVTT